ncbi:MAG: choice-of-anchor D domain-containing protein [Actinobacteria bacterium]|nr:choice-of-anchor D domain-containing protein [Actinomycetota bacterium]
MRRPSSEGRITPSARRGRWVGTFLAGTIVLLLVPPLSASAATDITAFTLDRQFGAGVNDGRSLAFTPDNATIFASPWGDGVRMSVSDTDHSFDARITPPTGQPLVPGTYAATETETASTAGLDVFGDGVGCSGSTGTVTIHEISFLTEPDVGVERFAATFASTCGNSSPRFFGELRYHSTFDYRAATHDPFSIDMGARVTGSTSPPFPVTVTNVGTLDLSLGSVTFSGDDAGDFGVSEETCSNSTLGVSATCIVNVTFTPAASYIRRAVLHIADDTARGSRDVLLTGIGIDNPTAVGLRASAQKVPYGATIRLTAHLRDFQESNDKTLAIYAKPYGGTYRLIASGTVDGAGDLSVPFTMKKMTTFIARFPGDDVFSPTSSATRAVGVSALVTGSLLGFYRTSGDYRLYHYTLRCPRDGDGCPTYTTKVTPNHEGKPVCFTLQLRIEGSWRTALSCFRLRLNGMSRATAVFVYASREIVGIPARVRATFNGDADHLAGKSAWSYFKITA